MVVAAADDAGGRDASVAAGLDDVPVAPCQAAIGQGQMPQPIRVVDIDPGIVDNQIGLQAFQQRHELVRQGCHEAIVVDMPRQRNISVACLLARREIIARVHGEGENPRVVGEDGSGAVALVDVQVHD